ncbi:MAG TPA: biotin carboxylase N-terminal domain-containing protein [Wenzhouxiangella sp.]
MASIKRLLIANRGEIAVRIIDTAKRLNIETVAVYSEADRYARHVRLADQAFLIGGRAAKDSYLNIDAIIDVAKKSLADAIHPGYGFLAENEGFAQAVADAGMVFVGPSAKTIAQMGSKAEAKALVMAAGVPVVPGYHGDDQSTETLFDQAQSIGFPLMIKAAAGGGGKGMRIVHSVDAYEASLNAARREAMASFGDDRVILERYLPRPRHIEAQIFGDASGRVIHLYERDCSSQRRHQKIIEEAPAVGLPESLREALLTAAVNAARAVGYVGAGTVEFLVDPDENKFYFLEMNTRLQVEHPVTEMITGLDLVEWQLQVASGESLPEQENVPKPKGHAFEARIYAEDPDQGFLPAAGRIRTLHWPDTARIDSGIETGDVIGIDYDPMIAKLIVHGPDRASALENLQTALDGCFIEGLTSNLSFLQALAASGPMQRGDMDTGHLDRDLGDVYPAHTSDESSALIVAASAWLNHPDQQASKAQARSPWGVSDGWRLGLPAHKQTLTIVQGHQSHAITAWIDGRHQHIDIDGVTHTVVDASHTSLGQDSLSMTWAGHINDQPLEAIVHATPNGLIELSLNHIRFGFRIQTTGERQAADAVTSGQVPAPMPGLVAEIHCQVGQSVQAGEVLAVMEAMKMELAIKAPIDGVVAAIHAKANARVDAATLLIELTPHETQD